MHEAQQLMGMLQHACQMIISKMFTGFIKIAQTNWNAFAGHYGCSKKLQP